MTSLTDMWKFQNATNKNLRRMQVEPRNIIKEMLASQAVRYTGQKAPKIQRLILPTQNGQPRDYDEKIYEREYAIERENVDSENDRINGTSAPTLLNLSFKLSAPVKQTLIKKLNDIIKEGQSVFSGEVSALKFLEIFKAFNELSFSYNEYISDIIKDAAFKMLFHSKLINLETIFVKIKELLANIASGKFTSEDLKIKTSGNYNGDYIAVLITQIISVINLMLLNKDTSQYLQDNGMSDVKIGQLATEPQAEVEEEGEAVDDADLQRKKAEEEFNRLQRDLDEANKIHQEFDEDDTIGEESTAMALARAKEAQYKRDLAFRKHKEFLRKEAEEDEETARIEEEKRRKELDDIARIKASRIAEIRAEIEAFIVDRDSKNAEIGTIARIPDATRTAKQKRDLKRFLSELAKIDSMIERKQVEISKIETTDDSINTLRVELEGMQTSLKRLEEQIGEIMMIPEEDRTEEQTVNLGVYQDQYAELETRITSTQEEILRISGVIEGIESSDTSELAKLEAKLAKAEDELRTAEARYAEISARKATGSALNKIELAFLRGFSKTKSDFVAEIEKAKQDIANFRNPKPLIPEKEAEKSESEKFVYDATQLFNNTTEDSYYKFLRINISPFMFRNSLRESTIRNIENGTNNKLPDKVLKSMIKGFSTPWFADYVKYKDSLKGSAKKPFNPITKEMLDFINIHRRSVITSSDFLGKATRELITNYEGEF